MDDCAADVVLFKQIENFFFTGLRVQVYEFFLLAGGGDEIFQDFSLCRVGLVSFTQWKSRPISPIAGLDSIQRPISCKRSAYSAARLGWMPKEKRGVWL